MNHRANDQHSTNFVDCATCESLCSEPERVRMRCGWLPISKKSRPPMPHGYPDEQPEVCPGYLVQMPAVIEGVRANGWREKGALREFYDGRTLTDLAKTATDIVAGAQREVENYNIRESQKPKG